jgi:hypothetical protein
VTLVVPIEQANAEASSDSLSIQNAVMAVAQQVGLGYDWQTSYANTNPVCRRYVRPNIKDQPAEEALQQILGPAGLTYTVVNKRIVLFRDSPSEEPGIPGSN